MSEPVKIIMYRTPAEAALWEGGLLWPAMASAFWAFIITLAVLAFCEKVLVRFGFIEGRYRADIVAIASFLIAFFACLKLVYGVI